MGPKNKFLKTRIGNLVTEQLGSHKFELLPFGGPKSDNKSNTERLKFKEWTGKTRDKDKDNNFFVERVK